MNNSPMASAFNSAVLQGETISVRVTDQLFDLPLSIFDGTFIAVQTNRKTYIECGAQINE